MVNITPKVLDALAHVASEGIQSVGKTAEKKASKFVTEVTLKPDTVELRPEKQAKTALQTAIELYNERKFDVADKFGSTKRVLNNWKDIYGVEAQDGSFRYAIEHLEKSKAIDKFITERFPELKDAEDIAAIRNVLKQYLDRNLDIYSYKRIDQILRGFNKEILPKLEDGAIIYVPNEAKSYNIITEMYKNINPDAKVVTGWNNLKAYQAGQKDVKVIVFDDCLVSGKSAIDTIESLSAKNGFENITGIDMYYLTAFQEGLSKLPKNARVHYAGEPKHYLINTEYFRKGLDNKQKGILMSVLGTGDSKYNAYSSIMFPYMAPNNNSVFGTQMIKQLFSGPECAIKNFTTPVCAGEDIQRAFYERLAKLK